MTSVARPPGAASGVPYDDPPAYDPTSADASPDVFFGSLNLTNEPRAPYVSSCIAHLRLLHTFMELKEEIGYTDGTWGIYDSQAPRGDGRAKSYCIPAADKEEVGKGKGTTSVWARDMAATEDDEAVRKHKAGLSLLREKRWNVFVARAVRRYELWWSLCMADKPGDPNYLKRKATENDVSFGAFPKSTKLPRDTKLEHLPPLDVLMVWHTHILNPRAYLADCMRMGQRRLWHIGFPWAMVNAAIDENFGYQVSEDSKAFWIQKTGRAWDNTLDSLEETIYCPADSCRSENLIPWTTTSSIAIATDRLTATDLIGNGLADGDLHYQCQVCQEPITRDGLVVARFRRDLDLLVNRDIALPGTELEVQSGTPFVRNQPSRQEVARDFPNRVMLGAMLDPAMARTIRLAKSMKEIVALLSDELGPHKPLRKSAFQPYLGSDRKMQPRQLRITMSRYHDNPFPFTLDLVGAVLRQGSFAEKMQRIDWLHSPGCLSTMERLLEKYRRFMVLMKENVGTLLVPTLDIDLAWHTAQLSPSIYYQTTVSDIGRFVDHDDKIDESKLSDSFEKTSELYLKRYQEVYSECTCWYCEATRVAAVGRVDSVFNTSAKKAVDRFYQTQAPTCPHDKAPHISSHSAVRLTATPLSMYDNHHRRLTKQYEKAQRRAAKRGQQLPDRGEYYNHWGTSYYMYGPWMYPVYFNPTIAPGQDCGRAHNGASGGACVAGTCTPGMAAGACGGAGGCGSCGGTSCGGGANCGGDGGGNCGGGCGSGCGGGCGG